MLFLLLSLADTEEKKDIISRIYEECYPALLRTALSILNNKHNAEDADLLKIGVLLFSLFIPAGLVRIYSRGACKPR